VFALPTPASIAKVEAVVAAAVRASDDTSLRQPTTSFVGSNPREGKSHVVLQFKLGGAGFRFSDAAAAEGVRFELRAALASYSSELMSDVVVLPDQDLFGLTVTVALHIDSGHVANVRGISAADLDANLTARLQAVNKPIFENATATVIGANPVVVPHRTCVPCRTRLTNSSIQYFAPQCRFDYAGECAVCATCPQGQYRTAHCKDMLDTVCATVPTADPADFQPPIRLSTNVGLLVDSLVEKAAGVYTQQVAMFQQSAPGTEGTVTASGPGLAALTQRFVTGLNKVDDAVWADAASANSSFVALIDRAISRDWRTVRVVLQLRDVFLNTKLEPSTAVAYVTATSDAGGAGGLEKRATCAVKDAGAGAAEAGYCIARLENFGDAWLDGSAITITASLTNGADAVRIAYPGNLTVATSDEREAYEPPAKQVWARLPDRPFFVGETFSVELYARAPSVLETGQISVKVPDGFSFSALAQDNTAHFKYLGESPGPGDTYVLVAVRTKETGLPPESAANAVSKVTADTLQRIATVRFKIDDTVAPRAKLYPIIVTVIELKAGGSLQERGTSAHVTGSGGR
jgi:hypothetical protein